MAADYTQILAGLTPFYARDEFPVLSLQCEEWAKSKPLAGRKIIDATPLFRNTLAKYAALLAGGAELHIARPGIMPHDSAILSQLSQYGIPVINPAAIEEPYDVVLDCAGYLSGVPSRHGYVELTKSGEEKYSGKEAPVWVVDRGIIKKIETSLGTGESFFRAMKQLGIPGWSRDRLLVIGYGKVGSGIVTYAIQQGIKVTVADIHPVSLPGGINWVPVNDRAAFNKAILSSSCAVTATGVHHALEGFVDIAPLIESSVILANMGVDDEWPAEIPPDRVLNNKSPLNFILDDPTLMCFIDPPMALHNAGAFELISRQHPNGLLTPSPEIEQGIMHTLYQSGSIPASLLNSLL